MVYSLTSKSLRDSALKKDNSMIIYLSIQDRVMQFLPNRRLIAKMVSFKSPFQIQNGNPFGLFFEKRNSGLLNIWKHRLCFAILINSFTIYFQKCIEHKPNTKITSRSKFLSSNLSISMLPSSTLLSSRESKC